MWYLLVVATAAALYFAGRRWGRRVYYRWAVAGRWGVPFRRALMLGGKSRPPTPPMGVASGQGSAEGGLVGGSGDGGASGDEGAYLLPVTTTTTVRDEHEDGKLHTVLSMSTDDYRKAALFATSSFDQDFQIPDLIGQTEILSEEHREKLCAHLPARAEGYSWSLVFSTSLHGFSLNSLYRKMHKLESPILIVIEDTDHNVFGALTSCSLHVSDHFYGTGESLLYKFNPHFKVFHWSGENLYFIKGNPESLAIGAGDGKFGLWLDGDLNQGRSQHCSTYSNEPLAPQEDFVIKTLECWAFV